MSKLFSDDETSDLPQTPGDAQSQRSYDCFENIKASSVSHSS